ncbi:MAG: glycosyltransferase family 2 protein [Oscillospiraceae bacterium]|nr:glycosyltransferase family 2 protein [Oscillospiraceae bacterium]
MQDNMISVIIPAYNCAQWLPRCLESLLNQTYPNLEIIVVNDGSKDNTIEVMTYYTDRYEHVKLITKKNGGEYAARVTGVEHARGSWVAFVDADDEVDPDMYERLMRNAQTYNAQISHCGFKMVYSDGKIVYLHNTGELRIQNRETALRDLLEEIIVENGLPGKLFRKELFDGIKERMDFSIVNNGDMLMNYYLFEKIETAVFEDFCPYHYLQRQGSASRQKLNKHIIYDPIRVRQILVDHCTVEMRNDVRCALARMCLISYRRIAMESRAEYREDREKVRELVAQQLPYAHLLPKRNAVLVKLISRAPWVFDLLYPPFEKMFRN